MRVPVRKNHPGVGGCRKLGCGMFLLLLVVIACIAALVWGIVGNMRGAHAQPHHFQDAPPKTILVLVDTSGSVMQSPQARRAALDSTILLSNQLSRQQPTAQLALVWFGAQTQPDTIIRLDAGTTISRQIQTAFAHMADLGASRFEVALQFALAQSPTPQDVVLITDGLPDPINQSDVAGQQAYAELLRTLAARLHEHGARVSVLLTSAAAGDAWMPVWREIAASTKGMYAPVYDPTALAQLTDAVQRLQPAPTATSLPTPTARPTVTPSPTATMRPTATVLPSPTIQPTTIPLAAASIATHSPALPNQLPPTGLQPTPMPNVQPNSRSAPTPLMQRISNWWQNTLWPRNGNIGIIVVGFGLVMLALLAVRQRRRARHTTPRVLEAADEGIIEITPLPPGNNVGYESMDSLRIDLHPYTVGEVLLIGNTPGSQFRLPSEQTTQSQVELLAPIEVAIALTSRGPLIEARQGSARWDGRTVRQHELFDGDALTLAAYRTHTAEQVGNTSPTFNYLLSYQNFFRQRPDTSPDDAQAKGELQA